MERRAGRRGGGSSLEELSRELGDLTARLACYVEREAGRRAGRAVTAREVRAVLDASLRRSELFGIDLSHPGWCLMLALFAAELEGRRLHMAGVAAEAVVAPTTALRWLDLLGEAGFVARAADEGAGRRVVVSLTEKGAQAMRGWFTLETREGVAA